MDPYSSQNFKIRSAHLGNIYFNPKKKIPKDISDASLILCPRPLLKEEQEALVEWAAASRATIFILPSDLEEMMGMGFGAHRFHKLDAYKEVDFEGGSLTFYPVRKEIRRGFSALWSEIRNMLGFVEELSFHVLIKPKNEPNVLVLSEPSMDIIDWELLSKFRPQKILGLSGPEASGWANLSKKLGIEISFGEEVLPAIETKPVYSAHGEILQKAPTSTSASAEKPSQLSG